MKNSNRKTSAYSAFRIITECLRRSRTYITVLSCLVVFIVTYLLILPAVTLDQNEAEKQGGGRDAPVAPPVEPVKVIKNKPVSFRTITGNKTYSIKTEADIDQMLNELRTALKAQLEEDTIIKLS